jgi:hypothetical protein
MKNINHPSLSSVLTQGFRKAWLYYSLDIVCMTIKSILESRLMKKVIKLLLMITILLFLPLKSFALNEIRGLHIASTGNNQYECAIKANIEGMRRALALVADRIGIKNSNFNEVPYLDLKTAFIITNKISETVYDERYTADVTYSYDDLITNNLILKYGSLEVKEQFLEYIIIPVFKQKNVISFLDTKTEWLATWIDNKDECSKHKLLPIDPTKMASNITTDTIFSMRYEEFLRNLKIKRFKKILIASCEYFTNPDGSMYFTVTTKELSQFNKNITETKYDIGNPKMAKQYFEVAIERIIDKFGQQTSNNTNIQNITDVAFESERSMLKSQAGEKAGSVLNALLKQPKRGKPLVKVQMRADIFSQEGLASFKEKLGKVTEVVKYKINIDDANHYIVELYTDKSMNELSEGFYINQLSYRISNGEYIAFELETGI